MRGQSSDRPPSKRSLEKPDVRRRKRTKTTPSQDQQPAEDDEPFEGEATCDTCEQKYGEPDRQSICGKKLKWTKTNKQKSGKTKVTGRECYGCGNTRKRKHKPARNQLGSTQEKMLTNGPPILLNYG